VSPVSLPPSDDANEEIVALIDTLFATGQRLEDLTAGEVDAVANRDGRTFMLRRAQDRLRQSDAAKQTAILNALPAHIALLDPQGVIVTVNEAWRQFSGASVTQCPGYAIGENYVDLCARAKGEGAAEARGVAGAIRSMLRGTITTYSFVYAFHSGGERRLFLMRLTPLIEGMPSGVVVMHLDVSDQGRDAEAVRRFNSAINATTDAIFLVDHVTMKFIHVNDAACRMMELPRDELMARGPSTPPAELEDIYDALISSGEVAKPVEVLRHRRDGSPFWVEMRRHALRSQDSGTIVTLLRDITERKHTERRIRRQNRVYAMLSRINALIVRVQNRDELFREACQIAVEEGGFNIAWVGLVDRLATKIVPIAWSGTGERLPDYITKLFLSYEGGPQGNTLAAKAIRDKAVFASNDSQHDSKVVYGNRHSESGVRSMAMLPLIVSDKAVGVLALYSAEIDFFDADELKILTNLAGDIAFAIDNLERQAQLSYLAYYDVLTGLANRALFHERLGLTLIAAKGQHSKVALVMVDIERFKTINDTLGRAAGDALLKEVAGRLLDRSRGIGRLARIDADHFASLMPGVQSEEEIGRRLEQLFDQIFGEPFRIGDVELRVSVKGGVALFPNDGADADTLFKNAEAALKKAKGTGDRFLFYTQTMNERVAEKLALENQLRQALDKNEFVLHYQPKISLETGLLTGAEALIRWNDPRTGLVPPGQFIPILEETGLIHEIGRWALRQAIDDYLRWRAAGLPAVRIAVNVSPLQLRHRSFIDEIDGVVGIDPHAAEGLELEITESVIMENVAHSIAGLNAVRALGVTIAVDDFGTGFSSLSHLARLPVDTLKIDRSFVIDMTGGARGLALVATIINLAHSLKLKVVAEGVETEEQSRLLRLLNCDEMQGFLFSRPVPRNVFEAKFLVAPVRG
jgi:diguanylate cyclase (GGDEF)-like protein/PAS domain S-box-containing protein